METLTKWTSDLFSDPSALWETVQENGRNILDILKAHPWTTLGVAAGTALVWSYVRAPRNLPPGPRNVPLIGATACLIEDLPQKMFQWREIYGETVSYYRFGDLCVMLNSERTVRQAFVKQGDEFSHRREGGFGSGVIQDEIFSSPYSETWKKNKKFTVTALKNNGFGTARSEDKINEQLQTLEDLLVKSNGDPIDISDEVKLLNSKAVFSIIIGTDLTKDETAPKELLDLVTAFFTTVSEYWMKCGMLSTMVNATILNTIYRKEYNAYASSVKNIVNFVAEKINAAAEGISEREAESVADAYLKERGSSKEVIDKMSNTIFGFLPDAIDTAYVLAKWCLLYICYYPEVQERMHTEVDEVIGQSRLPSLSDRTKMSFFQAVICETLRVKSIMTMSMERQLITNVKFDGYDLPKGTVVTANFYSVNFDPAIFPEPEKFNPSRFITAEGNFDSGLAGKVMAFSTGPRMCIGENYFKTYMFYFITRLLQKFRCTFDPSEPAPSLENTSYFIPAPADFKVCFKAK